MYGFVPGETCVGEAMETAVQLIGERHAVDAQLEDVDEEAVSEEDLRDARLSIANMLNPIGKFLLFVRWRCKEYKFATNLTPNHFPDNANEPFETSTLDHLFRAGTFDTQVLLSIRNRNDSQVKGHKGNEKKKRARTLLQADMAEQHRSLDAQEEQGKRINPSACSKLVAVLVKGAEGQETSILRMHRWNIHVKLNILEVTRNTSTRLEAITQLHAGQGSISRENPLEFGIFVTMIKNQVCFFLRFDAF